MKREPNRSWVAWPLLALVMALAGCAVVPHDEAASQSIAELLVIVVAEPMEPLVEGAEAYHDRHGRWPRDLDELRTVVPAGLLDRYEGLVIEQADGDTFGVRFYRWVSPDGSISMDEARITLRCPERSR